MLDTAFIERQKVKAQGYMLLSDPKDIFEYHDWEHVEFVINSVMLLLKEIKYDKAHQEDLIVAAIWHDADFSGGKTGHERRSAKVAIDELREEEHLNENRLRRISRLILSTKISYVPIHEDEGLIRDADLSYLGTSKFLHFYNELFREKNNFLKKKLTEEDWRLNSIAFMEAVKFNSEAAERLFGAKKRENLEFLKKMKT